MSLPVEFTKIRLSPAEKRILELLSLGVPWTMEQLAAECLEPGSNPISIRSPLSNVRALIVNTPYRIYGGQEPELGLVYRLVKTINPATGR